MLRGMGASGTNIYIANGLVAGQRAQHFMIHVIPRKDGDNLLQLDEKLIDEEMQEKVRITVENKLNELLGIKKKTVPVQDKLVEEEVEPEEEKKDEIQDDQITEDNESDEEPEDDDEQDNEDSDDDDEESENDYEQDNEKKEDVNLDDIANLFK
tara:strand:- start:135 stop:596 length:462 start_codon:yes stop_codon:yes gene_type:complete